MNVFDIIRNQLIWNDLKGKEQEFTITQNNYNYPEKVIVYMTKQKTFKVTNVKKEFKNGKYVFTVQYKDFNPCANWLDNAYDIEKNKQEQNKRKYMNRLIENDMFRQEFECPNWSSEPDEYGYCECRNNNRGYEKIGLAESEVVRAICSLMDITIDEFIENDYIEQIDELMNEYIAREWQV